MSKDKQHLRSLEGFKKLFDTLYPSLCLFANRYLKNMDIAKDIVQEVFISLWIKKQDFKIQNTTKAYLYTCVKNHCLNQLKSKRYRQMHLSTNIDLTQLHTEAHFQSELFTVETYTQLYKAINALPEKAAKVITLALNHYSNKDIAEELDITTSTVRTQKSIAIKKLKVLLNQFHQLFLNF